MEVVTPFKEGADAIKEAGGEGLNLCLQCKVCTATCPWNIVKSFPVHKMIREASLGLPNFKDEEWWLCTTCDACVKKCRAGVEIIEMVKAVRRIMLQGRIMPASLRVVSSNLRAEGNPWGKERKKRADWAKDMGVKRFHKDMEFLYFPCCTPAYDPRGQKIAQATAEVLTKAGIDFGILGEKENCCGESIRKAGEETLFQTLTTSNIDTFAQNGIKKIITTSPHCYYTFKNEYPDFGADFEVIHFVEIAAKLLKEGRLNFKKPLNKRATYHDPCYLGRHSSIYDEPREILNSIAGLEFIEMPHSGENSICCGGGGARIWQATKKGERLSDLRIKEAIEVEADVLVTACPYCILNFEDSLLSLELTKGIEIKDISELILEAI
jgi:Fe-S oxidoreductase